jgi:predicted nucleic acid-binding protein
VFRELLIPMAVLEELQSRRPSSGREWVSRPAEWLRVESAGAVNRDLGGLDQGEAEVIALAERPSVKLVLLDERKARRTARERGLLVVGALGIIDRAAALGMVDLVETLERLRRTNFRAAPSLIRSLLAGPRK